MLINQSLSISTAKILLVPYQSHHVPKYHEWMKDPAIQEATASEPLSLAEEYDMQRSWRQDSDKLTFISCLPSDGQEAEIDDDSNRMVGDVNLFLTKDEDDDDIVVGELELMVAEQANQGKGYGRASLVSFMTYISKHEKSITQEYLGSAVKGKLQIERVRVKIGQRNVRSIKLFESLGFQKISDQANYFGEFELRLQLSLQSIEPAVGYLELPYLDQQ